MFPEYKIETNSKWRQRSISKLVRNALHAGSLSLSNCLHKFVVVIPKISTHPNHDLGKGGGLAQQIDPKISSQIEICIKEGMRSISEIKRNFKKTVKEVFGSGQLPDRGNRRFYPSDRVIRNRVYRAQSALRRSLIDQECLF